MFPYPELLATILFSGFFLVLGNSYGNSVAFAKHTMLAANPAAANTTELDSRIVRLIAIFVLSIVCLLHYFSSRSGLFLNRALALFKVILLFTVFVAGVKVAHKEGSGLKDFSEVHGKRSSGDGLAAMVLILYAYQGWENANYVSPKRYGI
jgi:amino acid transporter